MKKPRYGPSLYYASDKNIFDALNQHKVDSATISELFLSRNIIVSKKTPREELAEYFSRLSHDYYDHKLISARLGVVPRRERVTSMDLGGIGDPEALQVAVGQLRAELEAVGDVVQIRRSGATLSVDVQYSVIDYRKSEFAQVQVKDGTIEFLSTKDGFVVRSTKNDYIDSVRDTLLGKVDKLLDAPAARNSVSLLEFTDARVRSKFFYDLATGLPGYSIRDVTAVYVYKPAPGEGSWNDEAEDDDDDVDTHVERVHLRGHGVSRSEILRELLDEDDYYITKIAWRTRELFDKGREFDIEALFVNPKDCTDFSFILDGIYEVELGKVSKRRHAPSNHEIDQISRVVEARARELVAELHAAARTDEQGVDHVDAL